MSKGDSFNLEILRDLNTKSLEEAQKISIHMLEQSDTKAARKMRLIYDIEKANTANEVSRIMWTTYMAGTGFRVVGSEWNKHYNMVG